MNEIRVPDDIRAILCEHYWLGSPRHLSEHNEHFINCRYREPVVRLSRGKWRAEIFFWTPENDPELVSGWSYRIQHLDRVLGKPKLVPPANRIHYGSVVKHKDQAFRDCWTHLGELKEAA